MKYRHYLSLAAVFSAIAAILACGALAQNAPPARSAAATQLRVDYYLQNFNIAVQDGKAMLSEHPKDLELRAWYIAAGGQIYGTQGLDAVVADMKKLDPKSPWTLLASAATTDDLKSKIDLCEQAIAAGKTDPDVLALATDMVQRASLIQSYRQHPPNADALKKFLAQYKDQYTQSSHALASKAQALSTVAQIEKDTKSTAALDLADQVLKSSPNNVVAVLVKSRALQNEQKYEDAYQLLKTAAAAVPDSYTLHQTYWRSVAVLPNANPEEQRKEIIADAVGLMSRVKPPASAVEMVLGGLAETTTGLVGPISDALLKKYPDSAISDEVMFLQAVIPNPTLSTDQNNNNAVTALAAFLARPKHYDEDAISQARSSLLYILMQQAKPNLDLLYKTMVAAGDADAATFLADHKSHLTEIETLASQRINGQWEDLQESIKNAPEAQVKGKVQNSLSNVGGWFGALGWAKFQQGNTDAAFSDLETASKLSPKNVAIEVHLGRAYEAKGENDKAEQSFKDALALPYWQSGEDPAVAALREMYIKTHGNQAGLDAYMSPFLAKDAARREKMVLATRLKPEKQIKPFELASLNGKEVSSKELKGKLLVINYWATW